MNDLEIKLATENEFAYRCYCPYCGEMHSYWIGRIPPVNGQIIKAENIVHINGIPAEGGETIPHSIACEVAGDKSNIDRGRWFWFRLDKMERIEL